MSRTVRLLLLGGGAGIVAVLVVRAGPRLVLDMLVRVGWGFPAVAAVYSVHQAVRAAALWRSVAGGRIRYVDVLRIRFSGQTLEALTFTGPFLAEPAKGWLLKHRGLPAAEAFAAVATEYLLYTVVATWVATVALLLMLADAALPLAIRPVVMALLAGTVAFNVAWMAAAMTGTGLIVPIVRASGGLIGASRAAPAADALGRVERILVEFLHAHPGRLVEVLAIESAAHALLMAEIGIVLAALGLPVWPGPLLIEGGVKFIPIAFFFVPGQMGVSEAAYTLLLGAVGFSTAAGLTLALVRRMRGLLVATVGLVVLAGSGRR